MRSDEEIISAVNRYGDTVQRICMVYLKNREDTENIFQTVFLKYAQNHKVFESDGHEKAWIITVTVNSCKDLLKSFFHSKTVELKPDFFAGYNLNEENIDVLSAVLSLPEKYRTVIYLYYYEGYSAPEIGKILHKKTNTVYTLITRSRQMLKERLTDYE